MEKPEEHSEIQNRSLRLDHEWVQVLINLRMKYAKSFSGKRNSATSAWNDILKEMNDLGAPKNITRLRIKKKWMNLIAKYKQLKCDANTKKQNAWPYFEQIDRAYSKKGAESKELCDNLVQPSTSSLVLNDDPKEPSEKEKFVRTLIDLRYKHCNLFTGKKYAAQKGWMLIQNYLPSGEKYSICQISKVWHNLVQNYKTLIEKEPDHSKITWVYFQQLHKIMSQTKDSDKSTTTIEFVDQYFGSTNEEFPDNCQNPFENIMEEKPEVVPFLTDNDVTDEDKIRTKEWRMEVCEPIKINTIESINDEHISKPSTSLTDLLNYMKERDKKREEQMQQMLDVMQEILRNLKQ